MNIPNREWFCVQCSLESSSTYGIQVWKKMKNKVKSEVVTWQECSEFADVDYHKVHIIMYNVLASYVSVERSKKTEIWSVFQFKNLPLRFFSSQYKSVPVLGKWA